MKYATMILAVALLLAGCSAPSDKASSADDYAELLKRHIEMTCAFTLDASDGLAVTLDECEPNLASGGVTEATFAPEGCDDNTGGTLWNRETSNTVVVYYPDGSNSQAFAFKTNAPYGAYETCELTMRIPTGPGFGPYDFRFTLRDIEDSLGWWHGVGESTAPHEETVTFNVQKAGWW